MKKILFLFSLLFYILFSNLPIVNAQSVSSVSSGVIYYKQSLSESDTLKNYSFSGGTLPLYPIQPTNVTSAPFIQQGIQFIVSNPKGSVQAKSYVATVKFKYLTDGTLYNRLQYANLTGGLFPSQGETIISTSANNVTVDEENNVTITYSANLTSTYTISSFVVSLFTNDLQGFANCGLDSGAPYCTNTVSQLSSLDINVEFSTDLNTGLLNNINTNQQITNDKLDTIDKNQQATNDKLDETNDLLKDTNNFLTSNEDPESDISALGNVQGLLPPGPVDSLLNIPFKFLSIIVSSLGDLCVPLSMSWVFNQTLTLPCFSDSFYNNVPSGLMVFINLIPTGFILIMYFKHLYKKVNRAVSMETTADDEWGVL